MVSGVTFKRDSMDQFGGSLRQKVKRFEMEARPPLKAVPEEPTSAAANTTKPAFSSSLFFSSRNQHQKEKVPLHHPKSPPKPLVSRLSASTHSSFRNTTSPVAATIPKTTTSTINNKTPPVYVVVPPSPAGTEYDGDDVVMADTDNNNGGNSGAQQEGLISQVGNLKSSTGLKRQYRSTPGASRFKPSSKREEEFKVEEVTVNYPPKPAVSATATTSYISKPVAVAASHHHQPQERKRVSLQLNTPTELFARVQALIAAAKENGVPTTSKSTIQKRLESAAPSVAPAPELAVETLKGQIPPPSAVELGAQPEVTPTTSNTNPLALFATMGNTLGTRNEGAAAAATGNNANVTSKPSHSSSTSKASSNPLFAGTPTHPTPPSISQPLRPLVAATAAGTSALPSSRGVQTSIRRYAPTPYSAAVAAGMQVRRVSLAGRTPGATGGRGGGKGGGNAAAASVSEGFKLAEQLAAVAERLASISPQCPPTNPIELVETDDHLVGSHKSPIDVTTKKTLSWTPPPPPQQQQAAAADDDKQYTPVRTLPQQQKQQQKDPVTPMFQDDVAKLLKALDAPTPATALRASRSSRLGNPQNQYHAAASSPMSGGGDGDDAQRLCSSSILDLDGFDSNGEKRADVALAGTPMIHPCLFMANNTNGNRAPGATGIGIGRSMAPNGLQLEEELRQAETRALKAEASRNEAAALLKDYQGTIASLQDSHASALARAKAALTCAQADAFNSKAEVEDLQNKLQTTEVSFQTLYHDKYVPLKQSYKQLHSDNGLVRGQNEKLRGLVKAEQSKVHQLAIELEKVRFESSQRVATAERRAEESRDAFLKLQTELNDNERRMREDAESAVAVAHAAKERASNELFRREEEVCSLSVKLKEVERMLGQYRAENEGFYETKQMLKKELENKEEENARLSLMCEELLQVAEEQGWALQ